jgi:hypothetical protein
MVITSCCKVYESHCWTFIQQSETAHASPSNTVGLEASRLHSPKNQRCLILDPFEIPTALNWGRHSYRSNLTHSLALSKYSPGVSKYFAGTILSKSYPPRTCATSETFFYAFSNNLRHTQKSAQKFVGTSREAHRHQFSLVRNPVR